MYEKFRSSVSSKNFIEKVNLKVCPYCNRNYIFNFRKNNKQEATAQLDHFIDKGKYPYLALCLYNLVPSCGTCNQRKSSKDVLEEPIYNPYSDNIHNHIKFSASEILASSLIPPCSMSQSATSKYLNISLIFLPYSLACSGE